MKILQIFTLIFLIGSFSYFANAQACGKFRIEIKVMDESGKPLENASVQVLPINKDGTRGNKFERDKNYLSDFTLTMLEGESLDDFHRLIISADGYKTTENELKVVSCRSQYIKVKLVKTDLSGEAVWDFVNRVVMQITDDNNKEIEKAWLNSTSKSGLGFVVVNGYLDTNFPNGIYDFQLKAKGFETKKIRINSSKIAEQDFNFKLKKATMAVLTGTVKLDKKVIKDAVIKIRDEDYNEYSAKTDDKGKYRIDLPFAKYFIYSTVNDKCWMCAEFYRHDFLINKEGEINLDINLIFMGEG